MTLLIFKSIINLALTSYTICHCQASDRFLLNIFLIQILFRILTLNLLNILNTFTFMEWFWWFCDFLGPNIFLFKLLFFWHRFRSQIWLDSTVRIAVHFIKYVLLCCLAETSSIKRINLNLTAALLILNHHLRLIFLWYKMCRHF